MKTMNSVWQSRISQWGVLLLAALAFPLLGGCKKKVEAAPAPRAVRSIVVEKHDVGDPIVVTGHVRARDAISLAFRLSGKVTERTLDVGDTVSVGQTVARRDGEIERSTRNAAQAELLAAQAALEQSEAHEKRMAELVTQGVISPNDYEVALRQKRTSKAQVEAAQARLKVAEDQLGFTELKSEAAGVITEKGVEPGEVVQAGQMILKVAQQSGRDAVFDMPARVIRDGLSLNQEVEVWLADNRSIRTSGSIREISPQADPITRNYRVKVGLVEPPEGMLLGTTVVGRLQLRTEQMIAIPSPALTMIENNPAVWVIDAQNKRVHRRAIKIARYTPDSVIVAEGLQPGESIVTAGVHELHEGQTVKLLGDAS